MLIGITGTDGAGKGTVVDYLVEKKGFTHFSARVLWIDELAKRGVEATRANMRLVGNEMRKKYGNDFVVTFYLEKIKKEGLQNIIIESIRAVAEAETLKANGGILLAIDAEQKIRYTRVQGRRSETDKVSFDDFVSHEVLEANDPNPHGMQKQKVMQMADYTLLNNISVTDLHTKIESTFSELDAR